MSRGKPFVYRWRDRVAETQELTPTQRLVAFRAADYADARGCGIYPGSLRLARECGLKVRDGDVKNDVVQRALNALVARGLLEQVGRGYRGRNAEYRLTLPPERTTVQSPNSAGEAPERATVQSLNGRLHSRPTNPYTSAARVAGSHEPLSFRTTDLPWNSSHEEEPAWLETQPHQEMWP